MHKPRRGSPHHAASILAAVLLLGGLNACDFSSATPDSKRRPYPYPYEPLHPAAAPLRVSSEASRRLFEGRIGAHEVRLARYTNIWPDGFRGGGRGLEPAGFPGTDLTSAEIGTLLRALAHEVSPVPLEDRARDGFLNSNGQVIFRLDDGSNALLLIGHGTEPNLLFRYTVQETRYNTSTRTLFRVLRDRSRVVAHVPVLFPALGPDEEDALFEAKIGRGYHSLKRFVLTAAVFQMTLGPINDIRLAKGRNLYDAKWQPLTATVTFRLRGDQGMGVVQATLTRNQLRAELIVTHHERAGQIGKFLRAKRKAG